MKEYFFIEKETAHCLAVKAKSYKEAEIFINRVAKYLGGNWKYNCCRKIK